MFKFFVCNQTKIRKYSALQLTFETFMEIYASYYFANNYGVNNTQINVSYPNYG